MLIENHVIGHKTFTRMAAEKRHANTLRGHVERTSFSDPAVIPTTHSEGDSRTANPASISQGYDQAPEGDKLGAQFSQLSTPIVCTFL